jgi:hypothetical protein
MVERFPNLGTLSGIPGPLVLPVSVSYAHVQYHAQEIQWPGLAETGPECRNAVSLTLSNAGWMTAYR